MHLLSLAILVSVILANLTLGFLVFQRAKHHRVNATFLLFVVAISAWAITNYLTDNTTSLLVSLWSARFANIFALLSVMLFWVFTGYFGRNLKSDSWRKKAAIFLPAFLISATPLGIADVTSITTAANQKLGSLYAVVVVTLIVGFLAALVDLIHGYRSTKNTLQKTNLRLMVTGFVVTFIFAIVTNVFLPILYSAWDVSRLGPVFTLFLVGTISFGIIRHKLFDIRLVVARSLGYILSLGLLASLYGLIVFGITQYVFGIKIPVISQIILAAMTGVVSLAFQPLHRTFDKLTNRFFYKDAYDPQIVLDRLSDILVGAIDEREIREQSTQIIQSAIKTNAFNFWLSAEHPFKPTASLDRLFRRVKTNIIVLDEVEGYAETVRELQNEDIAVAVRLRTRHDNLGYITLGLKESGEHYNIVDKRLLSIAADEIAITLQNALHFQEIQSFNITLQSRVEAATHQLRSTNARLRALDETKDDFISMASHQLRTPLTSVKGYISMVLEGDAGKINDTQRQMLTQAFSSSQRMVYLIADLLNVSRLKTGKFIIEPVETDLVKMISDEMDQLREAASVRNLTLNFTPPKEFPVVLLDETKTRQVVMNFIDNAIYYTPSGGHIDIQLDDAGAMIEMRVVDDGIGVPKDEQHHLFTKFYRAGNARRARPDGTGLGLFMAKKVIVGQGGVVIFDSIEGKGSTFGFMFPKDKILTQTATPATPETAAVH